MMGYTWRKTKQILNTYHGQLSANIAHCYTTREKDTWKPWPYKKKIRLCIPTIKGAQCYCRNCSENQQQSHSQCILALTTREKWHIYKDIFFFFFFKNTSVQKLMDILEHIEYFIVIVTASQLNCRHCYSVVYHQAISWNLFSKISGKFKHINFFF